MLLAATAVMAVLLAITAFNAVLLAITALIAVLLAITALIVVLLAVRRRVCRNCLAFAILCVLAKPGFVAIQVCCSYRD